MRTIISEPQVDAYILQLGVNDYRYDHPQTSLNKPVDNAKRCFEKLLPHSSAKIIVSLPTPTPSKFDNKTLEFGNILTEFISDKRKAHNNHKRLFTVNNYTSFLSAIRESENSEDKANPLNSDNLHVSEYGLKKLCLNIKYGIYRAFNMKPPMRQAPAEL